MHKSTQKLNRWTDEKRKVIRDRINAKVANLQVQSSNQSCFARLELSWDPTRVNEVINNIQGLRHLAYMTMVAEDFQLDERSIFFEPFMD